MESVKADMSGKKKVLLPEALSDLEKRQNCEFGFDEKVEDIMKNVFLSSFYPR